MSRNKVKVRCKALRRKDFERDRLEFVNACKIAVSSFLAQYGSLSAKVPGQVNPDTEPDVPGSVS